mgnify:CR=1 FL=1
MKKIFLSILAAVAMPAAYAQFKCATDEVNNARIKQNPQIQVDMDRFNAEFDLYMKDSYDEVKSERDRGEEPNIDNGPNDIPSAMAPIAVSKLDFLPPKNPFSPDQLNALLPFLSILPKNGFICY